MIPVPSGVQVWLATGHTDMRKGFDGLALLVQETLRRNPHDGHLFVFRGRRGSLIKVLWHDGQGVCLYAKVTVHYPGLGESFEMTLLPEYMKGRRRIPAARPSVGRGAPERARARTARQAP